MKQLGQWNFFFFRTWIEAKLKKLDFSKEKNRYKAMIFGSISVTVLLLTFSIQFFFKTVQLNEMVLTLHKSAERRHCSIERKRKLEEMSKKMPFLTFMQRISLEVQSAHYKKELKMITQFQGFELLKGHESKIVFTDSNEGNWKFVKSVTSTLEGFQEYEYTLAEPLQMSDEELKTFLSLLDL
jgi:hypothetical protein